MEPNVIANFHSFDGPIFFPALLGPAIAVSLTYGLTIPLFAFLAWVYKSRGLKSRTSKSIAFASVICFLLWTVYFLFAVVHAFVGFGFIVDIAAKDGDYASAADHNNRQLFPTNIPLLWVQNMLFIISDVIVLWRALILFPGRRWIVYILLTFWSINLGISTAACTLTSSFDKYMAIWSGGIPIQPRLNDAFNYISLGLNIIATILLSWRLWMHISLSHQTNNKGRLQIQTTGAGRVLALLVEAGALLCCFMLANFVIETVIPDNPNGNSLVSTIAKSVIGNFTTGVFAAYPSLITVLAYFRKSVVVSAQNLSRSCGQISPSVG